MRKWGTITIAGFGMLFFVVGVLLAFAMPNEMIAPFVFLVPAFILFITTVFRLGDDIVNAMARRKWEREQREKRSLKHSPN